MPFTTITPERYQQLLAYQQALEALQTQAGIDESDPENPRMRPFDPGAQQALQQQYAVNPTATSPYGLYDPNYAGNYLVNPFTGQYTLQPTVEETGQQQPPNTYAQFDPATFSYRWIRRDPGPLGMSDAAFAALMGSLFLSAGFGGAAGLGALGVEGAAGAGAAGAGVTAGEASGLAGEGALFSSIGGPLATGGVTAGEAAGLAGEGALFSSIGGPLATGVETGVGVGGPLSAEGIAGIGAQGGEGFLTTGGGGGGLFGQGGFLGTGLTPAETKALLGAVQTGVGLGTGLAGGGGGGGVGGLTPGGTTTGTSGVLDPQTQQLLDTILRKQFPARFGGWLEVLRNFVQRANASPQALDDLLSPQLRQLGAQVMQANTQASRELGPYGGAQIPARMGQGIAGAGAGLGQLSSNAVLQGQRNLGGFLSQTQLPIPQGRTSQGTTRFPTDPNQVAGAISGLGNLFTNIYQALPSSQDSSIVSDINRSGVLSYPNF